MPIPPLSHKYIFFIYLLQIYLSSCNLSHREYSGDLSVIGKDDRKEVANRDLLSAIGQIKHQDKSICTGFLVYRDVVATAAHCVPFVGHHLFSQFYWQSASGISRRVQYVINSYYKTDIVFLKIDPIMGVAPLQVSPPIKVGSNISLPSMKQGKLFISEKCSFSFSKNFEKSPNVGSQTQLMFHNCDTEMGASGAPIFQNGKVVGIHLGSIKKQNINIGIDIQSAITGNLSSTKYFSEISIAKESTLSSQLEILGRQNLEFFVRRCNNNEVNSKVLCALARISLEKLDKVAAKDDDTQGKTPSTPTPSEPMENEINICTTIDSQSQMPSPPVIDYGPRGANLVAWQKETMWPPGSTLRIRFLNGTEYSKNHFLDTVKKWGVGLKIEETTTEPSEIRVLLPGPGNPQMGFSDSQVGSNALKIPSDKYTIRIGWKNHDTDSTILHEFGHALGFIHELFNPNANILWNKEKVYNYFEKVQNPKWERKMVDDNIFNKQPSFNHTFFDSRSIMIYAVPADWTLNGFEIKAPRILSELDKEFAHKMYPPIRGLNDDCGGFAGVPCARNYYRYGGDTKAINLECKINSTGFDQIGTCVEE